MVRKGCMDVSAMPSFTIFVPMKLYERILEEASKRNCSTSKIICEALEDRYGEKGIQAERP